MNQPTGAPKVSVIIASFNMGQYLSQAIESVLAQTFTNIEVIVIDDGSQDDTRARVAAISDPRLQYHYQTNQGQTLAKNAGIARARGDIIGFCDADDLWHPQKLEWQLPLFEDAAVGVVYCDTIKMDAQGQLTSAPPSETPTRARPSGWVCQDVMIENFVPFGTALVRRQCLFGNSSPQNTAPIAFNPDYRMGIDWDLWLRLSLDWKFAHLPRAGYTYREWDGQMSNNYRGRYQQAREILKNFIDANKERLPKNWIRAAWSDMNTREANILFAREQQIARPLKLHLQAITLRPLHAFAWKSLIKLIINRR